MPVFPTLPVLPNFPLRKMQITVVPVLTGHGQDGTSARSVDPPALSSTVQLLMMTSESGSVTLMPPYAECLTVTAYSRGGTPILSIAE